MSSEYDDGQLSFDSAWTDPPVLDPPPRENNSNFNATDGGSSRSTGNTRQLSVFNTLVNSPKYGHGASQIFTMSFLRFLATEVFEIKLSREAKRQRKVLITALEDNSVKIFEMLTSEEISDKVTRHIQEKGRAYARQHFSKVKALCH
jgi:hypothetical protein